MNGNPQGYPQNPGSIPDGATTPMPPAPSPYRQQVVPSMGAAAQQNGAVGPVPPQGQFQPSPHQPPGPSAPLSEETGGFGLSLAGLITACCAVSLVGLILSIVGLNKARMVKRVTSANKKANASFVMGIIGAVLGGMGIVAQIVLVSVLLAGGTSMLSSAPELEELSPAAKSALADGVFEGEDAKAVAEDLKQTLLKDLDASKCKPGDLKVKGLKVDSSKMSVDKSNRNCRTVRGSALLDYGGTMREVAYVIDYVQADDGKWYLYSYTFDDYGLFPGQFAPNTAITQGNYAPSVIGNTSSSNDAVPRNTAPGSGYSEAPSVELSGPDYASIAGSYYCYSGIPATSPYSGLTIDINDTPVSAEVHSDGTMDFAYTFNGSDSSGYVSVDLAFNGYDTPLEDVGGRFKGSGWAEVNGLYSNQVGGGLTVPCIVRVDIDVTVNLDGTMTGVVSQSLVSYDDPSGMYNPGGAFDTSFDFTAYRA